MQGAVRWPHLVLAKTVLLCREASYNSQGQPSYCAHRAGQVLGSFVCYLASWNDRMLLDVEGSIKTARLY